MLLYRYSGRLLEVISDNNPRRMAIARKSTESGLLGRNKD